MKYYLIDDYQDKKLNKKKLVKTVVITILIIAIVILVSFYIGDADFRSFVDINILKKQVTENTGVVINEDITNDTFIYAYNGKIVVLNKNRLINYNKEGKQEYEIEVNISNPLFSSKGEYLCVAEKTGNKLYLISGQNIVWRQDLDGHISRVDVNKNGYISVILTGTTDKTVVITYSNEGKKISSAYLSETYAVDSCISPDNKYLAIAELNLSGTLVQSNVKVIELEKQEIVYTYKAESKKILTSIKYQNKNKILCMFDDTIVQIDNFAPVEKAKFTNDTLFADINLNNSYFIATKKSSGIFSSETELEITNVQTGGISLYKTESAPKEIASYGDYIAINYGTEVEFINTNGWLIKKYTSTRDVKQVILGQNIAGIVYKNKIEIVNL